MRNLLLAGVGNDGLGLWRGGISAVARWKRIWRDGHGKSWRGFSSDRSQQRQGMELIKRAREKYLQRTAVVSKTGESNSYEDVLRYSGALSRYLVETLNVKSSADHASKHGDRIAFLCTDEEYVATQWAIWRAGGVAVPLSISHPKPELEYVVNDAECNVIVAGNGFEDIGHQVAKSTGASFAEYHQVEKQNGDLEFQSLGFTDDSTAMIIYTSGTTGKPKGVVTSHRALEHQIRDMVSAWGWHSDDHILHCLPLHHVHGIVAKLCCALWSGASVEFIQPDPNRLIQRLSKDFLGMPVSVFMAVPTIYARLIAAYDQLDPPNQERFSEGVRDLRLMVSGSAALPESVMRRWEEISGHKLLERYGMSEFAMALTNPLEPVDGRLPGYVGLPFPSVDAKIVDENGKPVGPNVQGSLLIRGPTVFEEYWKRPEATREEFDSEGWFKTGDVALFDADVNSFKILGRQSVDIIKTGGYKVSALEIERELLEHPDVAEVAVLGVEDEEWGERVACILRLKNGGKSDDESEKSLREWLKSRLPKYKVPSIFRIVNEIPKNAMGKVNKKELRAKLL